MEELSNFTLCCFRKMCSKFCSWNICLYCLF